MSGKTPGQAAYEAAEAHSPYGAPPWDDVNDKLRAAWEAAAQAAIDAVSAEPAAIRIAPCPVDGHDEDHVQMRTGAAWLCGHQLARLLAENGITAALPAIVTAGTEHLAAQLAELAEEGR